MGHGPRGLQPGRRRLELPDPRPGALAGLPLGRGRHRRHLRRTPAAVPGAGAVERRRPDPQGADLRAHQQRGQPRRGRQGVLVLPRQHADALVPEVPVQVSAARVPVRGPRGHERSRGKQDYEYELLDTGVFDEDRYFDVVVEYAKAAHDDILMRVTAHNRGPEPAPLHLLPTLWFRNTWRDGSAKPTLTPTATRCSRATRRWASGASRPPRRSCSATTRPGRRRRSTSTSSEARRSTPAPAPSAPPTTSWRSPPAPRPRSACG